MGSSIINYYYCEEATVPANESRESLAAFGFTELEAAGWVVKDTLGGTQVHR